MTRVRNNWGSCHLCGGLITLALSGTILTMQLLFWFRYIDDPAWHWPKENSLIGCGSAVVLALPAVLLLCASCIDSLKLLYGAVIFGFVSALYCISVGVRDTTEYALGDVPYASVVWMGFANLVAGIFVGAYLILLLSKFCCCPTCVPADASRSELDPVSRGHQSTRSPRNPVTFYDWGISQPRHEVVDEMPKIRLESQLTAPTAPPPYQP